MTVIIYLLQLCCVTAFEFCFVALMLCFRKTLSQGTH